MEKICKYLRVKITSLIRLFGDIPFVYKLIMMALLCFAVYALIIAPVDFTIESIAICLCVFALTSVKFCSFSFSEKVLLKTLDIKILPLFFIRLVLLSIPFFLLNPYIGLVMISAGSMCAYFLSKVDIDGHKAKAFPSFYRKASYQWLSAFRRGGLWMLTVGFLLFVIALYVGNNNMLYAVFGWLMCVPFAIALSDVRAWLVNYKGVSFLLRRKLVELLFNASLPALICLPLVAIFMSAALILFVKLFIAFLFVDLMMFYGYYMCYPSPIKTFFCSVFLISTWSVMMLMHPVVTVTLSAPVLLLLHLLTIQNLKSILYVKPAP